MRNYLSMPIGLLTCMALPACGADELRTEYAARSWRCVHDDFLAGPIDGDLEEWGGVEEVRVCGDQQGRAAVVWTRCVDREKLEWDQARNAWIVRGSRAVLKPGKVPPGFSTGGADEGRRLPDEEDLFKPGQYLGGAVLGPNGMVSCAFLPHFGPTSGFRGEMLGALAAADGRWWLPLALWGTQPSAGDRDATHGLAMASFDVDGWQRPRMVIPQELPQFGGVWVFKSGAGARLFWRDFYNERWDLPDFMGGIQRERIRYAPCSDASVGKMRTVYRRPNFPRWVGERDHQLLQIASERYDLLLRRDVSPKERALDPDELIHVADLLGKRRQEVRRVGVIETTSRFVALPTGEEAIEVVCLESPFDRGSGRETCTRLLTFHYERGRWSPKRMYPHFDNCDETSLAAAVLKGEDPPQVLAVWRGSGGILTYSVGVGGRWSRPQATPLIIGSPNWLVSHGGRCTLVSRQRGNLFWCQLTVEPDAVETVAPTSGDNRDEE